MLERTEVWLDDDTYLKFSKGTPNTADSIQVWKRNESTTTFRMQTEKYGRMEDKGNPIRQIYTLLFTDVTNPADVPYWSKAKEGTFLEHVDYYGHNTMDYHDVFIYPVLKNDRILHYKCEYEEKVKSEKFDTKEEAEKFAIKYMIEVNNGKWD